MIWPYGITRRRDGRIRAVIVIPFVALACACGARSGGLAGPAPGPASTASTASTDAPPTAQTLASTPATQTTIDGYKVETLDLTEQPAIAIRGQAAPTELESKLGVDIPKLIAYALANSLQVAGPPFVRYLTRTDALIEYEAGLPVLRPGDGTELIVPTSLPAGPAAATIHMGPYQGLPAAHAALETWRAARQRTASGPGWEVFLTNPLQEPEPKNWRTKVFLPLQP